MRRLLPVIALILSLPVSAAAKGSAAQRFDVTIRVMEDGSLQVTETTRLTFHGGPFTYVSREIPLKKTDGIDVLGASMDGRVLSRGSSAGQFDVRNRDGRVAVRWHFDGVADATHEFRLSYLARGVVQRVDGSGVVEWQALPSQHPYQIDRSRIRVEGVGLEREPGVSTRRVADARVARATDGWNIEAQGIGSDGWIAFRVAAPIRSAAMPRWQLRRERERALAPRMIQLGALAAILGLVFVLLVRRQSPPQPILERNRSTSDVPPSSRPPAIASAIVAGGRAANAHAIGTLYDLAARGSLAITERERRWKALRRFTITRTGHAAVATHESALLDVILGHDETVDFSRAARRLVRGGRPFRHAVNEELERLGLVDEQRRATRRRLFVAGITLVILSIGALVLTLTAGAGPFGLFVTLGFDLAAVTALVLGAMLPELSDEGLRERERWRAFRRGLREHITGSTASMGSTGSMGSDAGPLAYLPYIAAFGLAVPLSQYLKKHGANAMLPSWFRALAGDDGSAAFAAFVATSGSSTGGGHAGGAGAAGGGSSSAG